MMYPLFDILRLFEGYAPGLALSIFLGLIFGSFASAVSYRIPRDMPWVNARSECTTCHHTLGLADLVPVFSWLFAGGKCRHCKTPIGARYPVIEGVTVLLCVGVFHLVGLNAAGLVLMLAMPFLVALIVIDLDHMILPDQLNLILFVLGLVYLAVTATDPLPGGLVAAWGAGLAGAVLYAGLLYAVGWLMTCLMKRDAVGFGDVKFLAVAGLWLGVAMLPVFLILSGLCGIVFGLIWKIIGRGDAFPFGPSIILAFMACLGLGWFPGIDGALNFIHP